MDTAASSRGSSAGEAVHATGPVETRLSEWMESSEKRGLFATFWLLVGYAILGVAGISVFNVLFDLNLALGTRGSSGTALPNDWESVIMLAIAGTLIVALAYFGSAVVRAFKGSKGPGGRIAVVVGALALLTLGGLGLQRLALTSTYGSMFVYYCTDEGDIEDVRDELAAGVTDEELDRCIGRTAQWDRHDLLPDIIEAGGDFEQATVEEEFRRCVLGRDVSVEYVKAAVELGATPSTCPNADDLVATVVRHARNGEDADVAEKVTLLRGAGWSTEGAKEHAENAKLSKTLEALE